ncbi:mitochondrial import inner membrane translocase subunit tim21 [Ranunculus cassubicifolius]
MKNRLFSVFKSENNIVLRSLQRKSVPDVAIKGLSNKSLQKTYIPKTDAIFRENRGSLMTPYQFGKHHVGYPIHPCSIRSLASSSAPQPSSRTQQQQHKKDISAHEDPFDAPTSNIPEKPVTFVEGASYSVFILAGLGIALTVGYTVCKDLLVQPKEYKVFDKALERVQNERKVKDLIGSPIKGYGQETHNRRGRRRIPHKIWTDEDGVERVRINFVARGPHGSGNVFAEMFKDKKDSEWKYTVLAIEIGSPKPVQIFLESYVGS